MKKHVAVFHLTTVTNSMQASAKIALFASEQLHVPVYDSLQSVKDKHLPQVMDAAILVNSPTGFADEDWRWFVAERCAKAKRFVFVQNDYKMFPPSQIRRWEEKLHKRASRIMWTTVPDRMEGHDARSTYVNWNSLAWQALKKLVPWSQRKPGLFYYGALRPDREEQFTKYLQFNNRYDVFISAPTRSHEDFRRIVGDSVKFYPPAQYIQNALRRVQATIYIEDPWSHQHFCSPAARFYEALSAGTAMFFDVETVYCMSQAKYRVIPWMVRDMHELAYLLPHAGDVAHQQYLQWNKGRNYREELKDQIKTAWKNLWR